MWKYRQLRALEGELKGLRLIPEPGRDGDEGTERVHVRRIYH